jgi:hypothetical protein
VTRRYSSPTRTRKDGGADWKTAAQYGARAVLARNLTAVEDGQVVLDGRFHNAFPERAEAPPTRPPEARKAPCAVPPYPGRSVRQSVR